MKARKLSQAEATRAARVIFWRTKKVDVHGWVAEEALASMGFKIPHNAIADGDDVRNKRNFQAWLRRNAVES